MCMFSISTYTLFFYLCAIHPTPKGVGFSHIFGNNEEEQIQDSRIHPDILRNILCGAYTIT